MMKRILCLLLITALLLSGCALSRAQLSDPAVFYYLRQHTREEDYDRFFSDGAIGTEERDVSGHRDDLNYLLSLYMRGPMDSDLRSPFPAGSRITEIRQEDSGLTIVMNAVSSRLSEMDITVFCACIAKTCMGLVDATQVTVESHGADGQVLFSRTFTNENLILDDTHTLPPESADDPK